MGGGIEIVTLCIITLLFGRRPKFFYYLTSFTFDKGLIGMLKIYFKEPRPFYIFNEWDKDTAKECSKEFGYPSGHSHASAIFSIMLFLDIFHGKDILNELQQN